jgi:hypothetical protein
VFKGLISKFQQMQKKQIKRQKQIWGSQYMSLEKRTNQRGKKERMVKETQVTSYSTFHMALIKTGIAIKTYLARNLEK